MFATIYQYEAFEQNTIASLNTMLKIKIVYTSDRSDLEDPPLGATVRELLENHRG